MPCPWLLIGQWQTSLVYSWSEHSVSPSCTGGTHMQTESVSVVRWLGRRIMDQA